MFVVEAVLCYVECESDYKRRRARLEVTDPTYIPNTHIVQSYLHYIKFISARDYMYMIVRNVAYPAPHVRPQPALWMRWCGNYERDSVHRAIFTAGK